MLYDCDEFTKTFYKETFDKDMVPVEQRTLPKRYSYRCKKVCLVNNCINSIFRDWRRKKYDQDFPPYNGFGSEEDSKTSCNGLEPRPPQRDFYKFMNRDRYPKMTGSVLKCLNETQSSDIAGLVLKVLSFDFRPGWSKTTVSIPRGSSSFLSSSPTTRF